MLGGMLPVSADTVRLFLHVLAATVWVGGQLTLAGLVPGLRALGPDVPRTVARRLNRIAWPAFGILFLSGLWNLAETNAGDQAPRGSPRSWPSCSSSPFRVSVPPSTRERRPGGGWPSGARCRA